MNYLGLDPGRSGAAAAINDDGDLVSVFTFKLNTLYDLSDWLAEHKGKARIEQVGARPEDKDRLGSLAKLMTSYGQIEGMLIAHKIPFQRVMPLMWQTSMQIPRRLNKTHAEHKRVLKQRAQELYPAEKITLNNADAVLLAVYCRLQIKFT